MADSNVLWGRKAICVFMGVSPNKFSALVERGLPVVKEGGEWLAHKVLIDEYVKDRVLAGMSSGKGPGHGACQE